MTPPRAEAAPENTPDDEALMAALASDDFRALDALMLRWQRPLHAFLYRHLFNEADALDLAQETFVRIHQHRSRYRPGSRFSTWMFQIALNLARDHARKRARRRTDSLEAAPPATLAGLACDSVQPDVAARRAEEVAAVRAALAELPEDLRAIVVLFEYQNLTHAEIAEVMGTTTKGVESRLYRAREKLRVRLARWLRD
jgi:RNA polymerase sigma-70 factor (ECF subfamily)